MTQNTPPVQTPSLDQILADAAVESAEGFAPAWRPDVKGKDGHPASIVGVVHRVDKMESKFGDYSVVTLRDVKTGTKPSEMASHPGKLAIHCMHTLMRPAGSHARHGCILGVTFKGEKPTKADPTQSYTDYGVVLFTPNGIPVSLDGPGIAQYDEAPVGYDGQTNFEM